jgi:hypothetical protein
MDEAAAKPVRRTVRCLLDAEDLLQYSSSEELLKI